MIPEAKIDWVTPLLPRKTTWPDLARDAIALRTLLRRGGVKGLGIGR